MNPTSAMSNERPQTEQFISTNFKTKKPDFRVAYMSGKTIKKMKGIMTLKASIAVNSRKKGQNCHQEGAHGIF